MGKYLFILLLACQSWQVSAQVSDSVETKRSTIFGLPLIFFTPETSWGFGAAGFYSWRFADERTDSRPSQIQLGGAYTLEDQLLLYLPFQLWWADEKYSAFGELGYYKYNYFFFGVGNEIDPDYEELYGVDYPRLRLTFMRRFLPGLYAGLRITADDFKITEVQEGGLLAELSIPGSRGGRNSGLGLILNYDTRDNIFSTHQGFYGEFTIDQHDEIFASDFDYRRLRLDIRQFFKLSKNDILATQFYSESIYGEAPFLSQAFIGGNQRMRGFYEGRYRDNHAALVQLEYRRNLPWRFGAVAFAGMGAVANEYSHFEMNYLRYTYGGGLRFALNEADRIHIRFDVGMGNGQAAYYLTINEAF